MLLHLLLLGVAATAPQAHARGTPLRQAPGRSSGLAALQEDYHSDVGFAVVEPHLLQNLTAQGEQGHWADVAEAHGAVAGRGLSLGSGEESEESEGDGDGDLGFLEIALRASGRKLMNVNDNRCYSRCARHPPSDMPSAIQHVIATSFSLEEAPLLLASWQDNHPHSTPPQLCHQ